MNIIILAAGKSTRMKSSISKCYHKIIDKPALKILNDTLLELNPDRIINVINSGMIDFFNDNIQNNKTSYVLDDEQIGTGNAVKKCKDILGSQPGETIVLYGDAPLLSIDTIKKFYNFSKDFDLSILTSIRENPTGLGRIYKEENVIKKIIEEKDANSVEKEIKEINTGIYSFDNQLLFKSIEKIKNNNSQNEYYLTDLVEIFLNDNKKVNTFIIDNNDEVASYNDRIEYAKTISIAQKIINRKHMLNGVSIIDPKTTWIGFDVEIDNDVIIYPNTHIIGSTKISSNTTIFGNSYICDSIIGENNIIYSSNIDKSEIKSNNNISNIRLHNSLIYNNNVLGPYSEINNTEIADNSFIGFSVYSQRAVIGNNVNSKHFASLGDVTIGDGSNIGAGTVIANYDGKNKNKTIISNDTFIGSNSVIISPVKISSKAFVAAGSTITDDVGEGQIAFGRARQVNKEKK